MNKRYTLSYSTIRLSALFSATTIDRLVAGPEHSAKLIGTRLPQSVAVYVAARMQVAVSACAHEVSFAQGWWTE